MECGFGIAIECLQSGKFTASSSGLKICQHFTICHSSLVSKFLTNYFKICDKIELPIAGDCAKFENVITNHLLDLQLSFKIYESHSKWETQKSSYQAYSGILQKLIVNQETRKTFYNLLIGGEWTFDKESPSSASLSSSIEALVLSSFILIQTSSKKNPWSCLQSFKNRICQPVSGEIVLIDSCPFGANAPELFLNSISRGIVGNISSAGDIFITDARCSLGCEGAPVYAQRHKNLLTICGLVISPFCWHKGEWIGLSVASTVEPLVHYLMIGEKEIDRDHENVNSGLISRHFLESVDCHQFSKITPLLTGCVVRIHEKDEKLWGSGVVVNGTQGIVVTCSHVVDNFPTKNVCVSFANGDLVIGKILFKSSKLAGKDTLMARDIAIIQIPPQRYSIPLSKSLPSVGSPIFLCGFPLFPKSVHKSPTFSSGNLAKIYEAIPPDLSIPDLGETDQLVKSLWKTSWRNYSFGYAEVMIEGPRSDGIEPLPFLLQTTCSVYAGGSGGPLIALHPIKGPVVIGIVSCCMKDNNSHFPSISFATPSWLLAEAVDRFILTKDVRRLDLLNNKCTNNTPIPIFDRQLVAKL